MNRIPSSLLVLVISILVAVCFTEIALVDAANIGLKQKTERDADRDAASISVEMERRARHREQAKQQLNMLVGERLVGKKSLDNGQEHAGGGGGGGRRHSKHEGARRGQLKKAIQKSFGKTDPFTNHIIASSDSVKRNSEGISQLRHETKNGSSDDQSEEKDTFQKQIKQLMDAGGTVEDMRSIFESKKKEIGKDSSGIGEEIDGMRFLDNLREKSGNNGVERRRPSKVVVRSEVHVDKPGSVKGLQLEEYWPDLDFLVHKPEDMIPLPLEPRVEYLGVLLDGGRHYFPVQWILNLIDFLHVMRFNLLHFRLTDDQAFNVKLNSHPELAKPAYGAPNGSVYSVEELQEIVSYARQRNVTVIPELNVPGHAAAWASHPYMVPACAKFICKEGYGIPLNVSWAPLMPMLKEIFEEVLYIFDNPPFLHMGGDEVHMSMPCFNELGMAGQDYGQFEEDLARVVRQLNLNESQVLRWEITSMINDHRSNKEKQRKKTPEEMEKFRNFQLEGRVAGMVHYWHHHHDELFDPVDGNGTAQVFVSQGLYLDTNGMASGRTIFSHVNKLAWHKWKPRGIVVGTFELGVEYWWERGVIGRMLAAVMGASGPELKHLNTEQYIDYCENYLKLQPDYCALLAVPPVSSNAYHARWRKLRYDKWKSMVCERLTEPSVEFKMKHNFAAQHSIRQDANRNFWNHFGEEEDSNFANDQKQDEANLLGKHLVKKTGIILDLTRDQLENKYGGDGGRGKRLKEIVNMMAKMGFNFLHLRLLDDSYFQLDLPSHKNLGTFQPRRANRQTSSESVSLYRDVHDVRPLSHEEMKTVVDYAGNRGVEIMPEISVSARAGGWVNSGMTVKCPKYICEYGLDLKVDIDDPAFLGVFASVVYDLRSLFSSSYFHLGYVHKPDSTGCFEEAGKTKPRIQQFENKIESVMRLTGFLPENLVRWEYNQTQYSIAGRVHTYKKSTKPTKGSFTTINLEDPTSKLENAFQVFVQARQLVKAEPEAVLAWIGPFGYSAWDRLLVRERLLAVAMGLSESYQDLSMETFESRYAELCRSFQLKCHLKGKIPRLFRTEISEEQEEEFNGRLEEICISRTRKFNSVKPREGVLVPFETPSVPAPLSAPKEGAPKQGNPKDYAPKVLQQDAPEKEKTV